MNEKILAVAHILSDYGAYGASRAVTLVEIQKVGYSEQTAIFLLEILENCVDDSYDKIANPVPARPDLIGEDVTEDSMGAAMRRANRSVLVRKEKPHDL